MAKKEVLTKNYKNALKYIKAVNARTDSANVPKLSYVETVNKYLGKKGAPLKSKLKSQKAIKEFNAAVKEFNKNRPRSKDVTKLKGMNFAQIAKEAQKGQVKMLKQVRDDEINQLREEINVGSGFINMLASDDRITTDDFYNILDMLKNRIDEMPESAKESASADDIYNIIEKLAGMKNTTGEEFNVNVFGQMLGVEDTSIIEHALNVLIDKGYFEDAGFYDLQSLGEALEKESADDMTDAEFLELMRKYHE